MQIDRSAELAQLQRALEAELDSTRRVLRADTRRAVLKAYEDLKASIATNAEEAQRSYEQLMQRAAKLNHEKLRMSMEQSAEHRLKQFLEMQQIVLQNFRREFGLSDEE